MGSTVEVGNLPEGCSPGDVQRTLGKVLGNVLAVKVVPGISSAVTVIFEHDDDAERACDKSRKIWINNTEVTVRMAPTEARKTEHTSIDKHSTKIKHDDGTTGTHGYQQPRKPPPAATPRGSALFSGSRSVASGLVVPPTRLNPAIFIDRVPASLAAKDLTLYFEQMYGDGVVTSCTVEKYKSKLQARVTFQSPMTAGSAVRDSPHQIRTSSFHAVLDRDFQVKGPMGNSGIFIGRVPSMLTTPELVNYFEVNFGPVAHIGMKRPTGGKSGVTTAWIDFYEPGAAARAVQMNVHQIRQCQFDVVYNRLKSQGEGDASRSGLNVNSEQQPSFSPVGKDAGPSQSSRKLFIGGLPPTASEHSLSTLYGQWGRVVDCVVMRHPPGPGGLRGQSRGFGFVTFADAYAASMALACQPHVIDGRRVDAKAATGPRGASGAQNVKVCDARSPSPSPSTGSVSSRKEVHSSSTVGSQAAADKLLRTTAKNAEKADMPLADPVDDVIDRHSSPSSSVKGADDESFEPRKIFVQGLPAFTTQADLHGHFSKFGRVFRVQLHQQKGFAFVTFAQDSSVDAAMAAPYHVAGRWVEVKRAQPRIPLPPVPVKAQPAKLDQLATTAAVRLELARANMPWWNSATPEYLIYGQKEAMEGLKRAHGVNLSLDRVDSLKPVLVVSGKTQVAVDAAVKALNAFCGDHLVYSDFKFVDLNVSAAAELLQNPSILRECGMTLAETEGSLSRENGTIARARITYMNHDYAVGLANVGFNLNLPLHVTSSIPILVLFESEGSPLSLTMGQHCRISRLQEWYEMLITKMKADYSLGLGKIHEFPQFAGKPCLLGLELKNGKLHPDLDSVFVSQPDKQKVAKKWRYLNMHLAYSNSSAKAEQELIEIVGALIRAVGQAYVPVGIRVGFNGDKTSYKKVLDSLGKLSLKGVDFPPCQFRVFDDDYVNRLNLGKINLQTQNGRSQNERALEAASANQNSDSDQSEKERAAGHFRIGECKVVIKSGDITAEPCDIMLCSVGNQATRDSSGPLFRAVADAAGSQFEERCIAMTPELQTDGYIVVPPGEGSSLSCRHVIHVRNNHNGGTRGREELLSAALRKAALLLNLLRDDLRNVIALPALFSGGCKVEPETVAKMLRKVIQAGSRRDDESTDENTWKNLNIVIVIRESSHLAAYLRVFRGDSGSSAAADPRAAEGSSFSRRLLDALCAFFQTNSLDVKSVFNVPTVIESCGSSKKDLLHFETMLAERLRTKSAQVQCTTSNPFILQSILQRKALACGFGAKIAYSAPVLDESTILPLTGSPAQDGPLGPGNHESGSPVEPKNNFGCTVTVTAVTHRLDTVVKDLERYLNGEATGGVHDAGVNPEGVSDFFVDPPPPLVKKHWYIDQGAGGSGDDVPDWRRMADVYCDLLSRLAEQKSGRVSFKSVEYHRLEVVFDVVQNEMTVSVDAKVVITTKIKSQSPDAAIPKHWSSNGPDKDVRKLVALPPDSLEFAEVIQDLDFSPHTVKKIERVENGPMYARFRLNAEHVTGELESPDGSRDAKDDVTSSDDGTTARDVITVTTRRLYHGTDLANAPEICRTGLNRNFAGERTGQKFGAGSYFTPRLRDAMAYMDQSPGGCLFVCEVVTGRSMKGYPGLKVLEPGFHSAVDNLANPRMYITFRDDMAYPLYLITFT